MDYPISDFAKLKMNTQNQYLKALKVDFDIRIV